MPPTKASSQLTVVNTAQQRVNIASLATRTAGWLRTCALIPSLRCRSMLAAAQQSCLTARPLAGCEARPHATLQRPAASQKAASQRLGARPAAAVRWAPALSRQRMRPFGRRSCRVSAGWGDPIDWKPAKVVQSRPAAEGSQRLLLDIGTELAQGYKVPGQFVQIRIGDSKPGFYAIASPPDPNNQGVVELLVKPVPESTAQLLADSQDGDSVEVSPVMGKGFAIAKLPAEQYSTVLMFATGSGIAPVKALIESSDLQATERRDVRLYYGTHSEAMTPFQQEAADWEGVQLVNVYSTDGKGYVQDVFARDGALADGASTGAVLCGQKQMCEQITQILVERGVAKENILQNF